MRYRLLTGLCMLGLGLGWGISWDAQSIRETPEITPTPVSADDLRVFPGDLVCDQRNPSVNGGGPSWMGIAVGQAILDEVLELLVTFRYEYRRVDDDDYDIRFVIWDPTQVEEGEPTSIHLCLDQDVVQVIAARYAYPLTMSRPYLIDLVTQFGEPDAITWNNGPSGRVAFWFEQGFAVGVSVVPNDPDPSLLPSFGRVGEEIYFPYQNAEGYEDRWPYNQTRKFNPFLVSPEDPISDFGPENPFDFAAMIATITAQPSRAYMPTSTPLSSTPTVTPTP